MNVKYFIIIVLLLMTVMLLGCGDKSIDNEEDNQKDNFHYQLQNANYNSLKELNVDYLIIDIDDVNLTQPEIDNLKNEGKTVLSYLSIGEAEDYRGYWQDYWTTGNPEFIDQENLDWPGNYKVQYWSEEWQEIVLDKVEQIASRGFSGVYLDIIDAYEYYEEQGRTSAAQEMIDFVKLIREKGTSFNSGFLIVPQNAVGLYEFTEYKQVVDGFGKEDTWYNDNDLQDSGETEESLSYLDKIISDNKFVLAIDYPNGEDKVCNFYKLCHEHNFVCMVSNRDLDRDSPLLCQGE